MYNCKICYVNSIQVPALVVVGRYDQVTPVSCSQEIANAIPDARLEIFEQSGHDPPTDESERFREILFDFLETKIL